MRHIYHLLLISVTSIVLWMPSLAAAQSPSFREVLVLQDSGEMSIATYSPNGKMIAAWVRGKVFELGVWNSINGNLIRKFNLNDDPSIEGGYPRSLSWSPDNRYLAGVVYDGILIGKLYVWDLNTGQRTAITNRISSDSVFEPQQGKVAILEARWNPKSMSIILIDMEGKIRLIDFPSGSTRWEISAFSHPYEYLCSEFRCQLTWNPDGTRFVSRNSDGRIFDGSTGTSVVKLAEPTYGDSYAKWTSDGKYIFDVPVGDGGSNDDLFVWNAITGNLVDIPIKKIPPIIFDLNPDAQRIAYLARYEGNEIVIANWHTGNILTVLTLQAPAYIIELTWSPDGRNLAVTQNGSIHIYAETIEELAF